MDPETGAIKAMATYPDYNLNQPYVPNSNISKDWDKITEIITQPWGGKTCSLTTIDGYIINIFE